jgi:non-specific serine/threonine protein kinase
LLDDFGRATTLQQEALHLAQESGDLRLIASVSTHLGVLAYKQGQYGIAAQWLDARFCRFYDLGDRGEGIAWVLGHTGRAARARGAASDALNWLRKSLVLYHNLGDPWAATECLVDIAGALCDLGQFEPAARLIGSAVGQRDKLGFRPPRRDTARQQLVWNAARDALGIARFNSIRAKGELAALDDAISEALTVAPSREHEGNALTRRELEVASRIARGCSNREIAEGLVIAVSTVERHVANILGKLDLTSRTQVAAWAHERGVPESLG